MNVAPLSLPAAGIDVVDITMEETYNVDGIGRDTITLTGTLVADRGAPLIAFGAKPGARHRPDWKTAAVVAKFTSLELSGKSDVFGPVLVRLDPSTPSYGMVIGGHCRAAIGVIVSLPQHDLTLQSLEPMQLQSDVTTVPPIGDERTESIDSVELVEVRGRRSVGRIEHARVMWRDLVAQVSH